MEYYKFALLVVFLSYIERCWTTSCVVDSFTVKQDFDPKKYAGKWYAQQKKDPEGLFLQDNISAEYTVDEDGTMTASSKGRVTLFGFWVVCADMAAQYTVPDPATPAKMFMNYQGLASYLSSGGDNYWIIDTDYDNYAVTYACRTLKDDGTCDDGYALVFSRNSLGLPPAIQRIVRQKQAEICMAGQFKPVLQSGQAMEKSLLNSDTFLYADVRENTPSTLKIQRTERIKETQFPVFCLKGKLCLGQ
ncbi:retinol binding protein 4, like [Neoarius graeffei]|uniref:retinol binding protein 4, like n=1 Tax=Neoarius graeffei TaxID=443677 RepID=UPI00298CA0B1|nr:retinol binding protein 4, like [Neoarius graeffei]